MLTTNLIHNPGEQHVIVYFPNKSKYPKVYYKLKQSNGKPSHSRNSTWTIPCLPSVVAVEKGYI